MVFIRFSVDITFLKPRPISTCHREGGEFLIFQPYA